MALSATFKISNNYFLAVKKLLLTAAWVCPKCGTCQFLALATSLVGILYCFKCCVMLRSNLRYRKQQHCPSKWLLK